MNSKFIAMALSLERGLKDMETFVEGMIQTGFVYRYGFSMSHMKESTIMAWFDAPTEELLNNKINTMDNKFKKYATTRSDKEFVISEDTWYCTYIVEFPFIKGGNRNINDHQGFKPLF